MWEINITEQLARTEAEMLSNKLLDTFKEYRDSIKKVDFKINVGKLKDDILSSTKDLL